MLITLLIAVTMVTGQDTDERYETTVFYFHYDPYSNMIVGSNYHICYIAPLTRQEGDSVHSDRGMEDIELALMREWISTYPVVKIYENDPALSYNLKHWCGHKTMYYIQRTMHVTTVKPFTTHSPSSISVHKASTLHSLSTRASTTTVTTLTSSTVKQPIKTTTEISISATSPPSRLQTSPTGSSDTPIVYIQSSPMKAILVTSQICYIYIMTDVESMMIKTGNSMKPVFENTLCTKDRTATAPYTESDPTITEKIKQHCPGTVEQFI